MIGLILILCLIVIVIITLLLNNKQENVNAIKSPNISKRNENKIKESNTIRFVGEHPIGVLKNGEVAYDTNTGNITIGTGDGKEIPLGTEVFIPERTYTLEPPCLGRFTYIGETFNPEETFREELLNKIYRLYSQQIVDSGRNHKDVNFLAQRVDLTSDGVVTIFGFEKNGYFNIITDFRKNAFYEDKFFTEHLKIIDSKGNNYPYKILGNNNYIIDNKIKAYIKASNRNIEEKYYAIWSIIK